MLQTTATGSSHPDAFDDPFFAPEVSDVFSLLGDDPMSLDEPAFSDLDPLNLNTDPFLGSSNSSSDHPFLSPAVSSSSDGQHSIAPTQSSPAPAVPTVTAPPEVPNPPSPVVIDPNEIDKVTVQLEKNQQCRCKSCNKLFNSVWYLKQHAVKHSNDRPFKCTFCLKTYKFRSNLYQHKCPERNRQLGGANGVRRRFYSRGIAYTEVKNAMSDELGPGEQATPSSTTTIDKSHIEQFAVVPESGVVVPVAPEPSVDPEPDPNVQFDLIPVAATPMSESAPPPPPPPVNEAKPPRASNSVRERPLDPAYIQDYLARNKHKLFDCPKCQLQFPSKQHLAAHMTAHSLAETFRFVCPQCPQKFREERRLRSHLELHAPDPLAVLHRCRQCDGAFRSAIALRRHIDQSRVCFFRPYGGRNEPMPRGYPMDPYAFIESEDESESPSTALSRTDSDASFTTSPPRAFTQEDLEEFERSKRNTQSSETDETETSSFRSRLNSSISCSPTSSVSSGDFDRKKYSPSEFRPCGFGSAMESLRSSINV